MRLSVYDNNVLDTIIEKSPATPYLSLDNKVSRMEYIDNNIKDFKKYIPKSHQMSDAEVLNDWEGVYSHRKELRDLVLG